MSSRVTSGSILTYHCNKSLKTCLFLPNLMLINHPSCFQHYSRSFPNPKVFERKENNLKIEKKCWYAFDFYIKNLSFDVLIS